MTATALHVTTIFIYPGQGLSLRTITFVTAAASNSVVGSILEAAGEENETKEECCMVQNI